MRVADLVVLVTLETACGGQRSSHATANSTTGGAQNAAAGAAGESAGAGAAGENAGAGAAGENAGAGGQTVGVHEDGVAPTVQITFPPRVSYSDAALIEVRGTAADDRALKSVTVNGVRATSSDGFATWHASVPLERRQNEIRATAMDAATNTASDGVSVTNAGPTLGPVMAARWEAARHRVVIVNNANAIIGWDPAAGVASLISDPRDGTEPGAMELGPLALDPTHDRALIIDIIADAIIAVDLETGVRSLISDWSGDDELHLQQSALTIDASGTTAFAMAGRLDINNLLRIDLETGERTVLSGDAVGDGPALDAVLGLAYDDVTDPGAPRLLITQPNTGAILSVDVTTGDRSVLSPPVPDDMPGALTAPISLALDRAGRRVLVADSPATGTQLFGVDLASGVSTRLISAEGQPSTPTLPSFWSWIDYDPASRMLYAGLGNILAHEDGDLLAVDLTTADRARITNTSVGTGPPFTSLRGAALAPSNGTPSGLLLTDHFRRSLLRVDLGNGNREQISGPERGAGPALLRPLAVILDRNPQGPSALVLDGGDYSTDTLAKLVRVDLESGDRTIISDDVHGEGPTLSGAYALAMDAQRGRVLVTCPASEEAGVYAIDLDSGDRSVVSSASRGSGPELSFAIEIVADAASDRALVVDGHQLFAVDLDSGDRTEVLNSRDLLGGIVLAPSGEHLIALSLTANAVLSIDRNDLTQKLISGGKTFPAGAGSGPAMIFPRVIALHGGASVAYVGDQYRSAVLAIDMLSGDRVIVSR